MILRPIWFLIKSLLFAASLYSCLWYITAQYVKVNLKYIISSYFQSKLEIGSDIISFSGYPFKFVYSVKNLSVSAANNNEQGLDLKFDRVVFTSNVLMDSLKIDLDDPINISTRNNKINYHIKLDEGSRMNLRFNKPLLLDLLSSSHIQFEPFYFSYFDSGYNIFDKNLDKIIFISASNKIRFEIFNTSDYIKYSLVASLDGEGGIDSYKDAQGEHLLFADISYSSHNKDPKNKFFDIQINKLKLHTENYELDVLGNIGNLEQLNKVYKLNIDIQNRDNFLKALGKILPKHILITLDKAIPKTRSSSKEKTNAKDYISLSLTDSSESYAAIKSIFQ